MTQVDVAFFDMDHTILDVDCSVIWKRFLADEGLASAEDAARAEHFVSLYHQGRYPVEEFVRFQYREFIGRTPDEMRDLCRRHFEERIRPFIYPDAQRTLDDFGTRGVPTVLVTGTNRFIAEPIVEAMGITSLLATEPEIIDGRLPRNTNRKTIEMQTMTRTADGMTIQARQGPYRDGAGRRGR